MKSLLLRQLVKKYRGELTLNEKSAAAFDIFRPFVNHFLLWHRLLQIWLKLMTDSGRLATTLSDYRMSTKKKLREI